LHGQLAFALHSPRAIHLVQGEHGEILRRLEVGWQSGVLEHTSGNISEKHKDTGKVTMAASRNSPTLFRTVPTRPPTALFSPRLGFTTRRFKLF